MASGTTQGRVDNERVTLYDGTTNKTISCRFRRSLAVQCVGTGTVTWEATVDGTNWTAVQATRLSSGASAQTATAASIYRVDCHGFDKFRAGSAAGFDSIVATASS